MAITLVTGLPGHGKTLNTIKEVRDYANSEGRYVYYHNIKGLSPSLGWHQLDDPTLWYECPPGAVILVDECQHFYPARSSGKAVPEFIAKFNTHRHNGHDIFLITQNPKLVDHDVRYLVNKHVHFFRPFGLERTTRIEWARCIDNPFSKTEHASALSQSTIALPKEIFGLYQSAEIHTVKRTIPTKLYAYAALPLLLLAVVIFLYGRLRNPVPDEIAKKASVVTSSSVANASVAAAAPVVRVEPEPVEGVVRGSYGVGAEIRYLVQDYRGYRRLPRTQCQKEFGVTVCNIPGFRYVEGGDIGRPRASEAFSSPAAAPSGYESPLLAKQ
jgi:zona occludens toxin (predicted ATPase)